MGGQQLAQVLAEHAVNVFRKVLASVFSAT
jgi:hypothetical protein